MTKKNNKSSRRPLSKKTRLEQIKTRQKNGWWKNPEKTKKKQSEAKKGDKNPASRACVKKKISKTLTGRIGNNTGKHWKITDTSKMSEARKGNTNAKGKTWKVKDTSKMKSKTNGFTKKRWQDPEFAKKILCTVSPNKQEKKLTSFLNEILPNEYKFVGDGEFILAGKCPDFLNINGQKKLIELYGEYWHGEKRTGIIKKDAELNRINYFRKFGFTTLIIWEKELQNLETLRKRILNFNYSM